MSNYNKFVSLNNSQKEKLKQILSLKFKEKKLKEKKKAIINELKKIKNNKLRLKSFLKNLKKNHIPIVSIGFDKRWSTYNCIIKIKGNSKSFYLGNENGIVNKIQQFYIQDLSKKNIDFIKDAVSSIIRSVVLDFYDKEYLKTLSKDEQKLNFKNILDRYFEKGDWTYWRDI